MPTTGKRIALGLDIGGTRLKALALDESHQILAQKEVDSHAGENPEKVRTTLREMVQDFRSKGMPPSVIGIGCAGSVCSKRGYVRNSPNFGNWNDVPLRDWCREDFGVPVAVDNDAKCAVMAEWKMGNGRGLHCFILLTLGTGIGGGIVLDDRIFRGNTGTAGELGHFSIYANGLPCNCGNQGCFERYCSGTAIRRDAGDVSSKEVFAHPEDPRFALVIQRFLHNFQVALTSLANAFDPQAILLGGQVSLGVAPYIPQVQEWVRTHAFPVVGESVKIRAAKFGNLSGSLGAALLAFDENPA